jgi:uncharacterized protein YodC (DUF2158 family)
MSHISGRKVLVVGDIVELRSGGPDMTVIERNGDEVECGYFDGVDLYSVTLPLAAVDVWVDADEESDDDGEEYFE